MVLDNAVPEEARGHQVGRVAGQGEAVRRADELGHRGVPVLAGEVVLMVLERLDEGAMLELVREVQPALVTSVGVEVDHDLVHAAELGVHHVLELSVGQPGEDALGPLREGDLHVQRRTVAGEPVGVPQAGVGLVERVPGRPFAVQVERGGALCCAVRGERPNNGSAPAPRPTFRALRRVNCLGTSTLPVRFSHRTRYFGHLLPDRRAGGRPGRLTPAPAGSIFCG